MCPQLLRAVRHNDHPRCMNILVFDVGQIPLSVKRMIDYPAVFEYDENDPLTFAEIAGEFYAELPLRVGDVALATNNANFCLGDGGTVVCYQVPVQHDLASQWKIAPNGEQKYDMPAFHVISVDVSLSICRGRPLAQTQTTQSRLMGATTTKRIATFWSSPSARTLLSIFSALRQFCLAFFPPVH